MQNAALVLTFDRVQPDDPDVLVLFDPFIREADGPLDVELDIEAEIAAGPPRDLAPPGGVLLLARVDDEPAGLGGVRHLETEVAEVKTMYVDPGYRGKGLARAILAELEAIAREHGCRATRLDTSDYLSGAVALYRAAGYREVPAYNENRKTNLWFERPL
jgi:GNAT superfamily N-acetyltransferase